MVEWSAVETQQVAFSPSTQQTVLFPLMPKDRGAEQGDVVAAEARPRIAQLAAGTLPWVGAHDPADAERIQGEQHSMLHRIQNFQLGGL